MENLFLVRYMHSGTGIAYLCQEVDRFIGGYRISDVNIELGPG